jgi:hypothetical protein
MRRGEVCRRRARGVHSCRYQYSKCFISRCNQVLPPTRFLSQQGWMALRSHGDGSLLLDMSWNCDLCVEFGKFRAQITITNQQQSHDTSSRYVSKPHGLSRSSMCKVKDQSLHSLFLQYNSCLLPSNPPLSSFPFYEVFYHRLFTTPISPLVHTPQQNR